MSTKERSYSLDILRIIAVFLILINHYIRHGFLYPVNINEEINFGYVFTHSLIEWPGTVGNWIFMLLSGYFLIDSDFSWKKWFKIYFQIFITSVVIGSILYLTKIKIIGFEQLALYENQGFSCAEKMSKKDLIKCFFPNYFLFNWYATAYLVFFGFVPYLKKSFMKYDIKDIKSLIIIMGFLGLILQTIPKQKIFIPNTLFIFCFAFIVGAYIKKNQLFNNVKTIIFLVIGVFILISFFLYQSILCLFQSRLLNYVSITTFENLRSYPISIYSPLPFLCAFSLLIFFSRIHIKHKIFDTKKIAPNLFGVYLISENPLINKFLWHKICKTDLFMYSNFIILHIIFSILFVFFICIILDKIRVFLFVKCFINKLLKQER